jgi:DNA-binding NtrC family response regulator
VFGIVKTHQGHIQCTSAVGQGTTMSLYFPRASSLEFALEAKTEQDTLHRETQQTKATILLVDDEEMIRELTLEFLQEQGHTVLTAAGGEEALQLHEAHKGQIDLVIIDLGMPGMSGEQCIAKMLQQDSATPILVASGYSGHGIAQNPRAYGVMGFMNKPYNFDTLSTHIEEVLAHKGVHKK